MKPVPQRRHGRAAARAFERGEAARAVALLREALPLVLGAGSLALQSTFLGNVARAAAMRGDWPEITRLSGAAAHWRGTLALLRGEDDVRAEREQALDSAASCLESEP